VSAINADTAPAWRDLAAQCDLERPSVGRLVQVRAGKRRGVVGRVTRHMVSRYGNPYRYATEAQAHMQDMLGRYGWTCRVQPATGPAFWTDADNVVVCSGGAP